MTNSNKKKKVFISVCCLLFATCLFLSVWGLTPLFAFLGHFKGSQSFKDLPWCHNQCFPQIFANNWQLEGRTDNAKTISPSKSSAGDNKIWKSITKICVWTESLSVYYVYLKVTKGHNLKILNIRRHYKSICQMIRLYFMRK